MFMAGIQALANLAPALHDPNASLLPDLSDVREVSVHVAAAIVRQACKEGRTRDETVLKVVNGELGEGLEEFIRGSMWDPVSTARCPDIDAKRLLTVINRSSCRFTVLWS